MIDKTCAMVRDDGGDLRTATVALGTGVLALGILHASQPIACKALGGDPSRMIPFFSHAISGACNGSVRKAKSHKDFRVINVEATLKRMQTVVAYTKKSAKGCVAMLRCCLLAPFSSNR